MVECDTWSLLFTRYAPAGVTKKKGMGTES